MPHFEPDELERFILSAQWRMLDKVLHWINEQDEKYISKGDLYDAVMELRPEHLFPVDSPTRIRYNKYIETEKTT